MCRFCLGQIGTLYFYNTANRTNMNKKIATILFGCAIAISSCCEPAKTITVINPTDIDRECELVEVPIESLTKNIKLQGQEILVVTDKAGQQLPTQITTDGILLFPATVAANTSAEYTIKAGIATESKIYAYGRQYPERVDDIAWENDKAAFRTYGPALQATGERAFGYDLWVKNVPDMVVEARYANELNPETKARIAELRKTNPQAANDLYKSISYHVDHGNGLDCYKVGPTLGGGAAALLNEASEIVYPYCYKEYEIMENGPLRFKVKLTYNPIAVDGNENIVETRIISLDKGSQLNKTTLTYTNLTKTTPVAAGIVIHPENTESVTNTDYVAYMDLTDNINNNNGEIYVGLVFPTPAQEAKNVLFSEKESKELRGGATGHALGISNYEPDSEFTYYWGAAWNKADIKSMQEWIEYLDKYTKCVRQPLLVK